MTPHFFQLIVIIIRQEEAEAAAINLTMHKTQVKRVHKKDLGMLRVGEHH
jgi:hypothetical protein